MRKILISRAQITERYWAYGNDSMSRNKLRNLRMNVLSFTLIWGLIWGGFIGLMVFDGIMEIQSVEAKTIIVDINGGGNYTSIQDAIDNASAGDTIRVWTGTYNENIVINHTLTIIGNGSGKTVINGDKINDTVYVEADWVNLTDLRITGGGEKYQGFAGIKLIGSENCSIKNNYFTQNVWGISLEHTNNSKLINNNFILNLGNAFYSYDSQNNTISDNILNDNDYGFELANSNYNILKNNTIYKCEDYGFYIRGSSNNTIIQNTITDVGVDGINLANSHYNLVSNNTFSNAYRYGIEVGYYSSHNDIKNNTATNNRYGFLIDDANNNFFKNNIGSNNRQSGFGLIDSFNNKIVDNTISNNGDYDVFIYRSTNNNFENNTIVNYEHRGIQIKSSPLNKLSKNKMYGSSMHILGTKLDDFIQFIDLNNTINNKPLYYFKNRSGINIPSNAGGIILVNCTNASGQNFILDNNTVSVEIAFSSNTILKDFQCSNNNYSYYLYSAVNNSFINSICKNSDIGGILVELGENNIFYNVSRSQSISKAIYLYKTNWNKIINCNFSSNYDNGIYVSASNYNVIRNNTCLYNTVGIYLVGSTNNEISNNILSDNDDYGISLYTGTKSNYLFNNTCSYNSLNGIFSYSTNTVYENNTCLYNGFRGMQIYGPNNKLINNNCSYNLNDGIYGKISYSDLLNNTCISNGYDGIELDVSYLNNINDSICIDNDYGINIRSGNNNFINNNYCLNNYYDGIYLYSTHYNQVTNNNLFNNRESGLYIHWRNSGNIVNNNTIFNNKYGVKLFNVNKNTFNFFNNNSIVKNSYGVYYYVAERNIIENCTITSNNLYDLYFKQNSLYNYAINSSFNTIYFERTTSELFVMNYLHIQVNSSLNQPVPDADVLVKDNGRTVYSSYGNGGNNPRTDIDGQLMWLLVTDRHYNGSVIASDNVTKVMVNKSNSIFWHKNKGFVDMNTTHFEYFIPNYSPGKVNLSHPLNNSDINISLPDFKWTASDDGNNDPITYEIQITNLTGNWINLTVSHQTEENIINWTPLQPLADGYYKWRVRAYDGFQNSPWSNISTFFIDAELPFGSKPISPSVYNNTGSVNWSWLKSPDTGSGITGYFVYIGTTPSSNDIINGAWTNRTWYNLSNLFDGYNYYCRIRVKNGVGTIGDFSLPSDAVYVDLDIPVSAKPFASKRFYNTDKVTWSWSESVDTGSGIAGYYVTLTEGPERKIVVENIWTTNFLYQGQDLEHNKTYFCKIKSRNGAGTIGNFSPESEGVTIDLAAPLKPFNLTANPPGWTDNNSFQISWSNPYDLSGIIGAFYKLGSAPISNTDGTFIYGIGLNHLNDFTLDQEGAHTFYIWLKDDAGNTDYTKNNSIILYYDKSPPLKPYNINTNPNTWSSTNSYTISWKNPNDVSGVVKAYYKLDAPPISNNDGNFVKKNNIDTITSISVAGDGEHDIYIWLEDRAGNADFNNYGTSKLRFDGTAPSSPKYLEITPDSWTNQNSFKIDWTNPGDLSGIKTGAYYYIGPTSPKSSTDGIWSSIKPLVLTDLVEGENKIYIWLADNSGNSDFNNHAGGILKLDTSPPIGLSMVINDYDEYINQRNIEVELDAADMISGIDEMSFSFDNKTWLTSEEYNPNKFLELPAGDGEKFVYVRIEDKAGNYEKTSDSIILDTVPPKIISFTINNDAPITDSTTVMLNIVAGDDLSGLNQMSFSQDGETWTDWEKYSSTKTYTITSGDGEKLVFVRTSDNAGNIAPSVYDSIELNTEQPLLDSDGDLYPDFMDKFPNDPTQWSDFDGDGYGDNPDGTDPDEFPEDPGEWKDTDRDGIGDNADAFPNDPSKWEDKEEPEPGPDKKAPDEKETNWGLIGGIIAVIIIVAIVLFFLFIKPRMGGREPPEEPQKEEPRKPADAEQDQYGSQQEQYRALYGDSPQQYERRNPPFQ